MSRSRLAYKWLISSTWALNSLSKASFMDEAVAFSSAVSACGVSRSGYTRCFIMQYSLTAPSNVVFRSTFSSSWTVFYSIAWSICFNWAISFDISCFLTYCIAVDMFLSTKVASVLPPWAWSICSAYSTFCSRSTIGIWPGIVSDWSTSHFPNSSHNAISSCAIRFFLVSKHVLNESIRGCKTLSASIWDMTGDQGSLASWSGCSSCAFLTAFIRRLDS